MQNNVFFSYFMLALENDIYDSGYIHQNEYPRPLVVTSTTNHCGEMLVLHYVICFACEL